MASHQLKCPLTIISDCKIGPVDMGTHIIKVDIIRLHSISTMIDVIRCHNMAPKKIKIDNITKCGLDKININFHISAVVKWVYIFPLNQYETQITKFALLDTKYSCFFCLPWEQCSCHQVICNWMTTISTGCMHDRKKMEICVCDELLLLHNLNYAQIVPIIKYDIIH